MKQLLTYWLIIFAFNAHAKNWVSPPAPPPRQPPINETTHPVIVIKYDNYQPGQVNLNSRRLVMLLDEVQWILRDVTKNKKTIRRITIYGIADIIKERARNNLDNSVL